MGVRLFAPPRRGGRYGVYECVGLKFWALDRGDTGLGLEEGVVSWGGRGGDWADCDDNDGSSWTKSTLRQQ